MSGILRNDLSLFYQINQIMANKIISLQGQNYTLGVDIALTIGYTCKGTHCITRGIIDQNPDGSFFYINGGISILIHENELSEYYPNNNDSRKVLKQIINSDND
jgi:hypothetical protein